MNRQQLVSSLLVAFALMGGAGPASAAGGEGRGPDPQRYQVPKAGTDLMAGAARSEVHAPIDVVQQAVTNYGQYGEYVSRFEKTKIVGKHGDVTDVYLQVPIMKGAAKIWGVVRFQPAKQNGGDVVVEGKMLKGNVKRLDARWRISKIDDKNTNLSLELFIEPDFVVPIPKSIVTGEAAFAACKAVRGLRNASEQIRQ